MMMLFCLRLGLAGMFEAMEATGMVCQDMAEAPMGNGRWKVSMVSGSKL